MDFTITCNNCQSTQVGIWHVSQGGEDIGVLFKCEQCDNKSDPY